MGPVNITVTGCGLICAAGTGTFSTLQSLYAGKRSPAPPRRFDTGLKEKYPVFEIDDFKESDGVTRTNSLLYAAASEAMNQAWPGMDVDKRRVGVAIGTTVGCTLNNEPFYRKFKAGLQPDTAAADIYLAGNPAEFLAERCGFCGPVASLANACSSGADAIGLAKSWIESGLCDHAVAGGSDELSRIPYLGFISLMNTSKKPCMPFDLNRSGLNLGEGAGILILSNDRFSKDPLAKLCAYASRADAYHPTAPHPEGRGLRAAIAAALKQSGLEAGQIGFINAHGTSTAENDRVEGSVIADLFGENIPVAATKAYTGHTLGAAGGVEAVFTVQSLIDGKIPSTPGFCTPDPACRITPVTSNTAVKGEFGLSNSLAFGGNNSVLIFGRA